MLQYTHCLSLTMTLSNRLWVWCWSSFLEELGQPWQCSKSSDETSTFLLDDHRIHNVHTGFSIFVHKIVAWCHSIPHMHDTFHLFIMHNLFTCLHASKGAILLPWHTCPMAIFHNLNHFLIFFGARALFNPWAIQLARPSFLAPMPLCVNVQESQYAWNADLKLLKQDTSKGYRTCDMCVGNVITSNPNCLAFITTSTVTWFAMSIHSQGMSVFQRHVPSHLLHIGKEVVKRLVK